MIHVQDGKEHQKQQEQPSSIGVLRPSHLGGQQISWSHSLWLQFQES